MNFIEVYENDLKKILNSKDVKINISPNDLHKYYHLTPDNSRYVIEKPISYFEVISDDRCIATWSLAQMPGCCGILVSTEEYVIQLVRNKGIGTILNLFRQELALQCGYTVLLCTDLANNKSQKAVLNKSGWIDLLRFVNRRTGNTVDISAVAVSLEENSKFQVLNGRPSRAKVSFKMFLDKLINYLKE